MKKYIRYAYLPLPASSLLLLMLRVLNILITAISTIGLRVIFMNHR